MTIFKNNILFVLKYCFTYVRSSGFAGLSRQEIGATYLFIYIF